MNILLTRNSIHIAGKPEEVLQALAALSRSHSTLGELLSSFRSGPLNGEILHRSMRHSN